MLDWFNAIKKLFAEPATLGIIISSGILGLVGGSISGATQFKHQRWGGVLRAAIIGMSVAIIVGLGVSGYISSEPVKLAIVGACAAIGEDIWAGLKALGAGIRKDPLGYLAKLIDALRGRPARQDNQE